MWNCLCLRNYEKRWRKIAASMRKWRGVTQIVYIEQLWVDSQKGSSMKHNKISKPMTRASTYWKRCQHFLSVGELSYLEVSSSQATTGLGGGGAWIKYWSSIWCDGVWLTWRWKTRGYRSYQRSLTPSSLGGSQAQVLTRSELWTWTWGVEEFSRGYLNPIFPALFLRI